MKKIFLFLLILFITNVNAEIKIGADHEVGLQSNLYYAYEETSVMKNRSQREKNSFDLKNIGVLYNYQNNFLHNNKPVLFEIQTEYKRFQNHYESLGTGSIKDEDHEILNLRGLIGIPLDKKINFKSGVGYRYLKDNGNGNVSTTGSSAYDRHQKYYYIPLLVEINNLNKKNSVLKFEYDLIFKGKNSSKISQADSSRNDLKFSNNHGYMFKASYKFPHKTYFIEPYYTFLNVQESTVSNGYIEPSNFSKEFGIKFTKSLSGNKNPNYQINDNNLDLTFGYSLLKVKTETGWYNLTGGGLTLEETNYGEKFSLSYGLNSLIDLETSFNDFGTARISGEGNASNTGIFRNLGVGTNVNYAFFANTSVDVQTNSVSLAVKPKYKIKNFTINGILGYHKWYTTEDAYNSNGTRYYDNEYDGIDKLYGFGLKYNVGNNFELGVQKVKYEMLYETKTQEIFLNYIF